MKQETEKTKSHFTLEEAEKLARKLEKEFAPICTKLKSLKPEVEKMQSMFKELCKGSVTIAGCRNFGEFCEKKLGRSRQTVYEMLGDYKKKAKARKRANKPALHQELALTTEDQERLRTGANAARRCFEAQDAGDQSKADEARDEFLAIAEAQPLASLIADDQPNYRLLLLDLLADIEKVGEKLPVALTRKCQAIRKRLGIDDKSFGLKPEDRMQPKPEQQPKTAEPEVGNADAQAKAAAAEPAIEDIQALLRAKEPGAEPQPKTEGEIQRIAEQLKTVLEKGQGASVDGSGAIIAGVLPDRKRNPFIYKVGRDWNDPKYCIPKTMEQRATEICERLAEYQQAKQEREAEKEAAREAKKAAAREAKKAAKAVKAVMIPDTSNPSRDLTL